MFIETEFVDPVQGILDTFVKTRIASTSVHYNDFDNENLCGQISSIHQRGSRRTKKELYQSLCSLLDIEPVVIQ